MKILRLISLFILNVLFIVSCRTEDDVLINTPVEETITPNSSLADLITRTSQNDGSADNIIDNASCISIQLPVTVAVNGTEILIDNTVGYEQIEAILEQFDDDVDTIEIAYPISVSLPDFTTLPINSDLELVTAAENCVGENENDDDIECIDFQYPINVFILDEASEVVDTIVINNDEEMYEFMGDLDEYAAVTIAFPITAVLANGSMVTVNSIQDLENVIAGADGTCDEDDDNDYDDDDCDACTTDQLSQVLVECTDWRVDKLERNDEDLEDLYTAYRFNFTNDGTLTVQSSSDMFSGTWQSTGAGNSLDMTINIPGLSDFNSNWNLHEIEQDGGENQVDLRIGDDRLRFESNCNTSVDGSNGGNGTGGLDDSSLVQVLTTGDWYVTNYFDDMDETALFDGQVFNFATNGNATSSNGSSTVNGNWSTSSGDETALELNLNFGAENPFDELEEDWDVLEVTNDILRLKDISGGDGTTDFLTFERTPVGNGNTGSTLSSVLTDGLWTVSSYLDDGNDQTDDYTAFTFNFVSGGMLIADNGNVSNGTWASQNGGNQLVLNFSGSIPLDEFTDDWNVISVSDTQVELRDVSGGDGSVDTLILVKQ